MVCVNDSIIEGNGLSCGSGVSIWAGGAWGGCPPGNPVSVWTWRNMNFLSCGHYVNNGECLWGNMALPYTGCTGPKYGVHRNGILDRVGLDPPGSTAGSFSTGGQVF